VHTAASGQELDFSITGPGINRLIVLDSYTGPGTGNPQYIGLSGDAYWDDVSAGYGPIPATGTGADPVPEPESVSLLGAALLSLGLIRRRKKRSV
jgi:hypothetical protein